MNATRRNLLLLAGLLLVVIVWSILRSVFPVTTRSTTTAISNEPTEVAAATETRLASRRPAMRSSSGRDTAPERKASPAAAKMTQPEMVDQTKMMQDPAYWIRIARHSSVKRYLSSPAKDTPECVAIAALCRKYGLGPWAVGLAYDFAWEHTHAVEAVEHADNLPQQAKERLMEVRKSFLDMEVEAAAKRYQWEIDPQFLDEVYAIRTAPDAFFGQNVMAGKEPMLDTIDWSDPRLSDSTNQSDK